MASSRIRMALSALLLFVAGVVVGNVFWGSNSKPKIVPLVNDEDSKVENDLESAKASDQSLVLTVPKGMKPVFQTESREVSYFVTRPVKETRQKEILYTVRVPKYETRKKTIPFAVTKKVERQQKVELADGRNIMVTTSEFVKEMREKTINYTTVDYQSEQRSKKVNYTVVTPVRESRTKTIQYQTVRFEPISSPGAVNDINVDRL